MEDKNEEEYEGEAAPLKFSVQYLTEETKKSEGREVK